MTEFEKKLIEQNEKMLKNQETIIEMLYLSPSLAFGSEKQIHTFAEHYYKHHGKQIKPLQKEEAPKQKQNSGGYDFLY